MGLEREAVAGFVKARGGVVGWMSGVCLRGNPLLQRVGQVGELIDDEVGLAATVQRTSEALVQGLHHVGETSIFLLLCLASSFVVVVLAWERALSL